MKLKSREELDQYRQKAKERLEQAESQETKIYIGMGTCGIAAGAQAVYDAINQELEKRNVKAKVIQTGCIGMCVHEPLVDVQLPGKARITYGNVKPSDVPLIINNHVLNGNVVTDLAIARFEQI